MAKDKEPVRLRKKTLSNGNHSLYLDIYVDGVRKYEFLKLYLIPERTRLDKERNKETLALANSAKASRVMDIQAGRFACFRHFFVLKNLFTGNPRV